MSIFFFFNDTATTEIYTLSLHDALPILAEEHLGRRFGHERGLCERHSTVPSTFDPDTPRSRDRKSTRLNSSHGYISYAVFCLKKKKTSMYKPSAQHTNADVHDAHSACAR